MGTEAFVDRQRDNSEEIKNGKVAKGKEDVGMAGLRRGAKETARGHACGKKK